MLSILNLIMGFAFISSFSNKVNVSFHFRNCIKLILLKVIVVNKVFQEAVALFGSIFIDFQFKNKM